MKNFSNYIFLPRFPRLLAFRRAWPGDIFGGSEADDFDVLVSCPETFFLFLFFFDPAAVALYIWCLISLMLLPPLILLLPLSPPPLLPLL